MSSEGLTDPHPQPSRHHPNRITTHAVSGTEHCPQYQSGKLRGRRDACFGITGKDWRVNLLNVLLTISLILPLLSKCLHKDSDCGCLFLCSVWILHFSLAVQIDHTAVWAFWVLEDSCFPPDFSCMQANPSILINRSDARLLFFTGHEIQHLLCYCFSFDVLSGYF